jgi:NADH-quinone oxidoreductase subunit G
MPERVNFTLDGRQLTAKKGELIIAAAERAGTYIPRFCYHPRMKPVGMCRMCLVEIKGPRGFSLQPACFFPVTDGMEVVTKSPSVKKAQDGILEFLLINHPLDCPVCDKGGECPLQDQTLAYGPGESRFVEEKRHWEKPTPLSPLVLLDRERCIQCARCTRFAAEVAGDPGIDFASRTDSTEVAIYPGEPFNSNFSGNVVQICPVGALLAKPYRFRARPWDLEQVETTCTLCAVGCRVAAQSSAGQVVRFLGIDSDPVNWGWLCDKGRFGFEFIHSRERLTRPLVRQAATNGAATELSETSWAEALSLVAGKLRGAHGERIGILGGSRLANEDAYAWSKFARAVLHTDNVDAQLGDGLPGDLIAALPRATIDQACAAPLVVTLAGDIKEELPVLYLRLRHAVVENGAQLVEISPVATGLSKRAAHALHYRPGELAELARALCGDAPIRASVAGVAPEEAEGARQAVAAVVAGGLGAGGQPGAPKVAVVIGRPSLAEPASAAAEAALLFAGLPGVAFLPALRRSNVHGAIDMGLSPGLLPGRVSLEEGRSWYEEHWAAKLPQRPGLDAFGILERAAEGRLEVLLLLGADPLSDFPDHQLAERALRRAGFIVSVDAFLNKSASLAAVVLPAATYTERRGSFTNLEGRVSWLGQKVGPPGVARPDWMIASLLAAELGADLGARSLEQLSEEVGRVSPLHAGLNQALLSSPGARDGVVVGAAPPEAPRGPYPIDPMADPGIASAELHPAPPLPGNEPGPVPAGAFTPPVGAPPRLSLQPPPAGAPTKPAATGPGSELRLATTRPMWDGGVLLQHSPSLACLHPPFALALHPDDMRRLGLGEGARAKLSSKRGSLVVAVMADSKVPAGTARLPYNLPEGSAGELIDASLALTEVEVTAVEEGR